MWPFHSHYLPIKCNVFSEYDSCIILFHCEISLLRCIEIYKIHVNFLIFTTFSAFEMNTSNIDNVYHSVTDYYYYWRCNLPRDSFCDMFSFKCTFYTLQWSQLLHCIYQNVFLYCELSKSPSFNNSILNWDDRFFNFCQIVVERIVMIQNEII